MGCGISTATRGKRHSQPQNDTPTGCHRKPPAPECSRVTVLGRALPPSLEQECVKEVLSETHLPKLHPEDGDCHRGPTQKTPPVQEVSRSRDSEMCCVSAVSRSEVSEMCSVGESFSTATTLTEKKDDEVVSKPIGDASQRVIRSPAKLPGKCAYARERVPRSSTRRTEPAPEKKGQAVKRSACGTTQSRLRQHNAEYVGFRHVPGEGSCRRSRSPASQARGGDGRSLMKQTKNKGEPQNDTVQQRHGNESLENLHVSLECFIFL